MNRYQHPHNYRTDRPAVPAGRGGVLKVEKSYLFVDKHPVIDEMRSLIEDGGYSRRQIAEKSGVTTSTLRNWILGKTKRPQAPTLNAVAKVFGKRLGFVDL